MVSSEIKLAGWDRTGSLWPGLVAQDIWRVGPRMSMSRHLRVVRICATIISLNQMSRCRGGQKIWHELSFWFYCICLFVSPLLLWGKVVRLVTEFQTWVSVSLFLLTLKNCKEQIWIFKFIFKQSSAATYTLKEFRVAVLILPAHSGHEGTPLAVSPHKEVESIIHSFHSVWKCIQANMKLQQPELIKSKGNFFQS